MTGGARLSRALDRRVAALDCDARSNSVMSSSGDCLLDRPWSSRCQESWSQCLRFRTGDGCFACCMRPLASLSQLFCCGLRRICRQSVSRTHGLPAVARYSCWRGHSISPRVLRDVALTRLSYGVFESGTRGF